tara:strand:+ start:770 stop:1213 length:444 start_codon:yes stop_codon:yes gene_type:complete
MKSIPTIQGFGRVVAQPEARYFENGNSVCKVVIYLNQKSKKDEQGNWVETPPLKARASVWGKQVESVVNTVKKGDPVFVSGSLEQEYWNDKKTGDLRTALAINSATIVAVEAKKAGQTPPPPGQQPQASATNWQSSPVVPSNTDIPF